MIIAVLFSCSGPYPSVLRSYFWPYAQESYRQCSGNAICGAGHRTWFCYMQGKNFNPFTISLANILIYCWHSWASAEKYGPFLRKSTESSTLHTNILAEDTKLKGLQGYGEDSPRKTFMMNTTVPIGLLTLNCAELGWLEKEHSWHSVIALPPSFQSLPLPPSPLCSAVTELELDLDFPCIHLDFWTPRDSTLGQLGMN